MHANENKCDSSLWKVWKTSIDYLPIISFFAIFMYFNNFLVKKPPPYYDIEYHQKTEKY